MFGLLNDLVKVVTLPLEVARVVTKPIAYVAEEITEEIKELLGEDKK